MARTDQRALPLPLLAVAAVLVILRVACSPAEPKRSLVRWVSPAEGVALAKATGKPILYDFTAEWCRPCHVLDEEVFADPRIAADINDRFVAVRVTDRRREDGRNPPEVDALQQRYSVQGFPTVIFADPGGSEQGRMEGYGGRQAFTRIMERVR